jgi:hypothetical protein
MLNINKYTSCGPSTLYTIFMLALITFDLTQNSRKAALRNMVFLTIGYILLSLLCRLGFEIVGWIILSLIPFFFVALFALFIITQIVKTDVNYSDGSYKLLTGKKILSLFGYEDINADKVYRPPGTGEFDIVAKPDPSPCDPPLVIPKISSAKRIIGQLQKRTPPETCCQNNCD